MSSRGDCKIALVLSGGGARGAFQCAAEKYAREAKGYHWDIIAGVSVGALNGAMLAMGKYERLFEIWNTISNDQVYRGGFNLWSVIRLLFGAKSFYSNQPLRRMLWKEFEQDKIMADLRVGAVTLMSGEYVQFTREDPHLRMGVLASTVMPIIWEPINVSPDYPAMVDGGVRNVSPIGDVLALEPDEIVIINCTSQEVEKLPKAPDNILKIAQRTIDLLVNEIFVSDLQEFLRINALVKQAEEQGFKLYHPRTGRPLKYYPCHVIEPDVPMGDVLDFSQEWVRYRMEVGRRRAMEVLG